MLFFKTNILVIKKTEKKRLHNKLKFLIICVQLIFFEHLFVYKKWIYLFEIIIFTEWILFNLIQFYNVMKYI